jgi:hypothetical protein
LRLAASNLVARESRDQQAILAFAWLVSIETGAAPSIR